MSYYDVGDHVWIYEDDCCSLSDYGVVEGIADSGPNGERYVVRWFCDNKTSALHESRLKKRKPLPVELERDALCEEVRRWREAAARFKVVAQDDDLVIDSSMACDWNDGPHTVADEVNAGFRDVFGDLLKPEEAET